MTYPPSLRGLLLAAVLVAIPAVNALDAQQVPAQDVFLVQTAALRAFRVQLDKGAPGVRIIFDTTTKELAPLTPTQKGSLAELLKSSQPSALEKTSCSYRKVDGCSPLAPGVLFVRFSRFEITGDSATVGIVALSDTPVPGYRLEKAGGLLVFGLQRISAGWKVVWGISSAHSGG